MRSHTDTVRKKILPVLRRYDVTRGAIFGSFARRESTENSDLDILVEFEGEKSLLDLAGLKMALEELLGVKVDVVTYNSLSPLLKERILSEQVVIL